MPTENKRIYDYTNILPIDPRTPIPVLRDIGTTKFLDAKPPIINFNLNPKVREYLAAKKQANIPSPVVPQRKPILTNQTTPTPAVAPQSTIEEEIPEKAERDNLSRVLAIIGGGLGAAGAGLLGQSIAPSTQQMIGGLQAIDQKEKDMELDNPKSAASIHARGIAKQVFGDKFSNPKLTARQFRESSPLFQQAFDNSFKQKSFEENLKLSKSQDALNWAKFNREKAELDAARAAGPAAKELKLNAEQEKRLALAKQLKTDYEQLAKMQAAGAESVTGKRADKKELEIIKNRILNAESVFQQQGQLEQGIRAQYLKNLGVGMLDSASDIGTRNLQRGSSYEDTVLKELSNQTGLDVAVDDKGNKYLVDPRTGQKVRKL